MQLSFNLPKDFIKNYEGLPEPFGFNGLGAITFYRTYSRKKQNGEYESWVDVCERVINGMYSIQKDYCLQNNREWSEEKGLTSAKEAFERMFHLKWTPSGRGLWLMGTPFIHERKVSEALLNCAAISTENINDTDNNILSWFMEMLMLGVGVSSDTRGKGKVIVVKPNDADIHTIVIQDTRESWAESVQELFNSYIHGNYTVVFDYSLIRKEGEEIRGFGGISSGPQPLILLHNRMIEYLEKNIGFPITSRTIVDIFNAIGACVVAGNVRRSAELMLGDRNDDDFSNLKNYSLESNQYRSSIGWTSNNSILADIGMDYYPFAQRTFQNGEPGYIWLDNIQNYGRMGERKKDNAILVNPCQPEFATILTTDGIRTIGDIGIGNKIWSEDGWVTIVNKWSTGVKPVYKYHTSFGTFIGTENHRVLSCNEKHEVKDVDSIDSLAGGMTNKNINPIDIMSGLVIGDGTIHKATGNVMLLCIGQKDVDYFDSEISHLIIRHRPGIDDYAYEVSDVDNMLTFVAEKTFDRIVPNEFYYGNGDKIAGFLRGIFSANGSVVDNGRKIQLKQSSYKLTKQIQEMLSAIGIRSYISVNKPYFAEFENGTYLCKESYNLQITKDRGKFVKQIGFLQKYKNQKIQSSENNSLSTGIIQKIEYMGDFEVFDMTVDGEHHTYWSGGLNISNCAEVGLENKEMCNLIELYPDNHTDLYDYLRSIKFAYLYGKSVSLTYDWIADEESRTVMTNNRRVGLSNTGISQFIAKNGLHTLIEWFNHGYEVTNHYDARYSEWLDVNRSIRLTTQKPSGSLSTVTGKTAGLHHPISRFYIRRIRLQENTQLVDIVKKSGIHVEKDVYSDNTVVAEFPVDCGENIRSEKELSLLEQFELTAIVQKYWADNAVSVTIKINPERDTPKDVARALEYYQYQLKTVSLLPEPEGGAYAQMPYEEITEERYNEIIECINFDVFQNLHTLLNDNNQQRDLYCDGQSCEIRPTKK